MKCAAIGAYPAANGTDMIEGRSINSGSLARVEDVARGYECPLMRLDSNHTHDMYLLSLRPMRR